MNDIADTDAQEITKASQSNLAFAFAFLPEKTRRDMSTFYAFCRVVDDIADEPSDLASRQEQLGRWFSVFEGDAPELTKFETKVLDLATEYKVRHEHFLEILRGVEMDFTIDRYGSFDDLKQYCHRVAGEVGLVSAKIFGASHAGTDAYAINLGLALQITNILRDVGQDWKEFERIYLPGEDLEQFGYGEELLKKGRHDAAFVALMRFEAERARTFFLRAKACLPDGDRKVMRAAEAMRRIYGSLLNRMERDGFRVFERRYTVPKWRKVMALLGI
ncbi:MAG: squalene/phytoene synthase family protein [Verrucomicrobiota bacterium]